MLGLSRRKTWKIFCLFLIIGESGCFLPYRPPSDPLGFDQENQDASRGSPSPGSLKSQRQTSLGLSPYSALKDIHQKRIHSFSPNSALPMNSSAASVHTIPSSGAAPRQILDVPPFTQPITLMGTEALELSDLFMALARQANMNLVLSPHVQGSLAFYAHKRPLGEVLQDICALMRLRFRYTQKTLHIEPDTPYIVPYNLSFLTLTRHSQNRLRVANDVDSSSGTNDQKKTFKLDNGSETLLIAESQSDFWEEVKTTLQTLLEPSFSSSSETEKSSKNSGPLEVFSPPSFPKSRFSIHKQAGLVIVYATEAQHHQVNQYFRLLRQAISSQVLIEAKIVEVYLKDEYKSGINWDSLSGDFVLKAPLGSFVTPGPFNSLESPLKDVVRIGGRGSRLTGLLSLMKRFGTLRTLSSPRLTVMNNQPALLKVATNQVYFRILRDRYFGFDTDKERESLTSELKTVPIGLVMVVQPSIDLSTNSVILTLRPTISQIISEVQDPAVTLISSDQKSFIPQVQVREFDSVIHMLSGETAILGGLMEHKADQEESGPPALGDLPLVGVLFKGQTQQQTVTELVIFLRATILEPQDRPSSRLESSVHPGDQRLYETFTTDPRPLEFGKKTFKASTFFTKYQKDLKNNNALGERFLRRDRNASS